MIIALKDTWGKARATHNSYLLNIIDDFTTKNKPVARGKLSKPFVTTVKRAILSNSRMQMDWSIRQLLKLKATATDTEYNALISDLKKVFNYTRFITKPDSKSTIDRWNAYALCSQSSLTTCPYCNYNYAHTIFKDKRTGKLRPTLDHFYPQFIYPHLGLTLANLIPSCYSCNSSLKGKEDFFTKKHLHPFFDKEKITFRCSHPSEELPRILSDFETVKDELIIEITKPSDCEPTKNSIALFALAERYEKFNKEGIEFIGAHLALEALISNLNAAPSKNPGERLNLNPAYIESRALRFEKTNYQSYPLGKMFYDLHEQFHRNKTS